MVTFRLGILLSFVWFSTFSSAEVNTLTFVGKSENVTNPVGLFLRSVLKKSYAELGYNINYIPVPLGRSLIEVNSGRLDGFLTRTGSITKEYPNLVKVPFSLLQSKILLFTNPNICGQCNISQLSSVATIQGFKAFDSYMADNPTELTITQVTKPKQALGMLAAGRVEGVVLPHNVAFSDQYDEKWNTRVISTYSSYHFIHKKHLKLVPKLQEQFEILHSSGQMSLMLEQALTNS